MKTKHYFTKHEITGKYIERINNSLQIVSLKNKYFPCSIGKYKTSGYAFYSSGFGYFGFEHSGEIYTPRGGKKALQSIIDSGGFANFYHAIWFVEMEEYKDLKKNGVKFKSWKALFFIIL